MYHLLDPRCEFSIHAHYIAPWYLYRWIDSDTQLSATTYCLRLSISISIFIFIYIYISLSLSLSLYVYAIMFIYVFIDRYIDR